MGPATKYYTWCRYDSDEHEQTVLLKHQCSCVDAQLAVTELGELPLDGPAPGKEKSVMRGRATLEACDTGGKIDGWV